MKPRAPRNRTLTIQAEESAALLAETITLNRPHNADEVANRVIHQDIFTCLDFLPAHFVDLLIVDPPYNLDKTFGSNKFVKAQYG
jgi:site-specific DNA-methyltransferase (adenine-specific)